MGSPERHSRPANRIAAFVLFSTIAVAPLPFGSRDASTVAIWCVLLAVGLATASVRHLTRGQVLLLAGVGVVVGCFSFVIHEQLSTDPWIAAPHPIWAKAAELLGKPIPSYASVVRDEPFYALGRPLVAILSLVLAVVVCADRSRARQAAWVVAWSGTAYSLYGIAALSFDRLGFFPQSTQSGALTATFINRNTAAAYFGSCAVVCLVLLLSKIRARLPAGQIVWREALQHIVKDEGPVDRQILVRCGLFFVCLVAMFLTGSRGGVLTSLLVMALVLAVFFRRDLPRGKGGLLVGLIGSCAVALFLLQVLGGNIEARIETRGLVERGRLDTFRTTVRMIADHPWFGTGLGTFASIYPSYRSPEGNIRVVWEVVHSTPLELAVEVGIPLTLIIVAAWIAALTVLWMGSQRSRRETVIPLAAFGAALIAVLHSSFDFSLQVSGYAMVVFAIAGIGLAEATQPLAQHRMRPHGSRSVDTAVQGQTLSQ